VRIENALVSYVSYLVKMLWPTHLAVYYPHPGPSLSLMSVLGAGVLLLVVTVLVLGPGRRWPYLGVGWLWYLGTLVPVIGLVQVSSHGMADRYAYVPLIGLFLSLTWGACDLAASWRLPRFVLGSAAVGVLSACAVLSWTQMDYWRTDLSLWEHALAVTENNAPAYNNLGNVLMAFGRHEEAERHYRRAIVIAPAFAPPHNNLGNLLWSTGRREEAVREYQQAIASDPNAVSSHYYLANSLLTLGRLEEAHQEYLKVLELQPDHADAYCNLGALLQRQGRFAEALAALRRGHELGSQQPGWSSPSAQWVKEGEELLERDARLSAVLSGKAQSAGEAERLALADFCRRYKQRHATSARFFNEVFLANPERANDVRAGHRYAAACASALAADGQGQDASQLSEGEKTRLRNQALDWLQADLAIWARQAQSDRPADRAAVREVLAIWQGSPDLACVRDAPALAKLPHEEAEGWRHHWQQVADVAARATLSIAG
jgi:Tfp pilus assembly protein PilF